MQTWMITGTSSGLGRALADQALAAGHQITLPGDDYYSAAKAAPCSGPS